MKELVRARAKPSTAVPTAISRPWARLYWAVYSTADIDVISWGNADVTAVIVSKNTNKTAIMDNRLFDFFIKFLLSV